MSVWGDHIRKIETELAELRTHVTLLESGKVKLGERRDNSPWVDITQRAIDRNKRVIETYEAILAALKKGQTP